MAETDPTLRSTLNRLSSLGAGQEQLQADVDRIRGDLRMLLILTAYAGAVALLTFLAVRYGKKVVP